MRSYFILIIFTLLATAGTAYGQQISGTVSGETGALVGASVWWEGTNVGAVTDSQGRYSLNRVRGHEDLVAAFLGYTADTIKVSSAGVYDFNLDPDGMQIDAVTVSEAQRGNYISSANVLKNENISFAGLTKMACCNLAESFENSASVSVGYSDAVSGARQIRMLGLSGIYTQLLDESRPVLRGIGAPYGLSYTPGMWLQAIQVAKGTTSVANGHEGLTGQINLEYRKPTDEEPLFINGYLDQQLRTELNVASSLQLNRKLSTVILAHGSIDERDEDHNHDHFLDVPNTRQVNFANRWLYVADNGMQFRAGVKFTYEKRSGGQRDFDPSLHRGGTEVYGSRIRNRNINAYFKAAMPVGKSVYNDETDEELRSNIALVADYDNYRQNSYFGLKTYDGNQNSFLANLMYNLNIDKRNKLVFGLSATYDDREQTLNDTYTTGGTPETGYTVASRIYDLGRVEKEAGVFGEYTFNYRNKLTLIAGIRTDYNNHYGWFLTPRGHVKWDIVDGLSLRASAGKGFRSANPITDNMGLLATGRMIVFGEGIDYLEEALTTGGSLTWIFRLGRDDRASLSFDYFRTSFKNQVVTDQEYDSETYRVYNAQGRPVTDTWQGDFNWTPFTGFDIFATFRYSDARLKLSRPDAAAVSVERPLIDRFKGLINLQYATKFRKWVFDFTAQVNGQTRLPVQNGVLSGYEYSPVYPMFFAQVSRKFRHVDVYVGCENIGNYTQDNPVISSHRPFETAFNSSVVWGPLMGRKIYAGFRFNL